MSRPKLLHLLWRRILVALGKVPWRTHVLTHDIEGLICTTTNYNEESTSTEVAWADVCRAVVFKKDLLTVDLICMSVEVSDGHSVLVHERMDGWDALVRKLPEYLPGCRPFEVWYPEVDIPPLGKSSR
jgi:hypothetical protein